ncbi:MAG TPA: oligopeptide transporter, OPT family, partial [Phycisphaerae bacterium]|nr:oligopeptide transporter, OPT family [Phycisphaerae bacterium]
MDQSPTKPDVSAPNASPERSLPEITVRAVLLGAALSVILGAANVYLGLKAGMTVAASIPAAVVSMGLLRIFRRPSILENNIVQTAASAGESLAAGVLFTLPALLILGVWKRFDYWSTTAIAALGGIIGVLFTVPLRRALVLGSELRFPEGVATAEVLRVGELSAGRQAAEGKGASTGLWTLVAGSLAGGLYKLGEAGLRLFGDVAGVSVHAGRTVWSAALGLAPALVGVGYIVGFNIAVLVFLGGAANWFVAIPIVGWLQGTDVAADPYKIARGLWSAQTRYIGVGAMVVGGLWALVRMWGNLVAGLAAGLQAIRDRRRGRQDALPREQRDMPVTWLAGALVACVGPMFFIFRLILPEASPALVLFMCLAMLVAAFVFSAVASYMAGLVGSSNNPISGVTIATILSVALLLMAVGTSAAVGPGAAILIGAVVCCAAAIGGDNMQDLKTGLLVGATPWKQQIMQMVGVLAGAVVMAPVLTVLLEAYGIGTITVEGQTPLEAPQATLMASVARGVFHRELP